LYACVMCCMSLLSSKVSNVADPGGYIVPVLDPAHLRSGYRTGNLLRVCNFYTVRRAFRY
jgi:hypothetical protein